MALFSQLIIPRSDFLLGCVFPEGEGIVVVEVQQEQPQGGGGVGLGVHNVRYIQKYSSLQRLLMPIAKRNKLVSLTQVKPKQKEHKEFIVNKVHSLRKRFKFVYVLSYENMTTNNFKALREKLSDSKFLMGKNKVIGVAFGHDEETSHEPNSYRITKYLKGHCVLFFTNKLREQCQQIFNEFEEQEYATGGAIASSTVLLSKGFDSLKKLPHSMEPYLRQLGLPTHLVNSQIELTSDFLLSEEGKPISVENCKLLKLLNIKMSQLRFTIMGFYDGKSFKA